MPLHLLFPCPTEPSGASAGTPAEYATSVYRKLQHAFKFRQENQEHAHEQQKAQYDKKAKYTSYNVGDLVWLNDPAHSRCKLAPRWKGPYTIKQNVQLADGYSVLYAIQPKGFPEKTPQVVHHNRLKPYLSSTYQLGQTVSDASSPIVQPVGREVPTSTSNSSTLAVRENLSSVVFTGEVPSQSPASSLILGQSPPELNSKHWTVYCHTA